MNILKENQLKLNIKIKSNGINNIFNIYINSKN